MRTFSKAQKDMMRRLGEDQKIESFQTSMHVTYGFRPSGKSANAATVRVLERYGLIAFEGKVPTAFEKGVLSLTDLGRSFVKILQEGKDV